LLRLLEEIRYLGAKVTGKYFFGILSEFSVERGEPLY